MNAAGSADLSPAAWRKSSRSSGGGSNCVEVARLPGRIAIRDSKNPQGAMLVLAPAAFSELIRDVRNGAQARAARPLVVRLTAEAA